MPKLRSIRRHRFCSLISNLDWVVSICICNFNCNWRSTCCHRFPFLVFFVFKTMRNVIVSAEIYFYKKICFFVLKEYFGRCALRAQLFQRRNWGNSTWLRSNTGMQLEILMIVLWRWLWNIHITMNFIIIINANEQGVGRLDGPMRTRLSREFTMSSPTIGQA